MNKGEHSVLIRVTLPGGRARQLETLASECGLEPADLARTWIIERLAQWSHASGLPATFPSPAKPSSLGTASRVGGSLVALPTPAESMPLETAKKMLAEKYITDHEEKTLFLQTRRFKQWANYIAGLELTRRGQKTFTPTDIKRILREFLIPEHYGEAGAKENEVLTADVRVKAPDYPPYPKDYAHGYPCLNQVGRGLYEFVGFKQAIRDRYGEDDLNRKLSRVQSFEDDQSAGAAAGFGG